MSIFADFVKQVGGNHVDVLNIIPVGAVAESYQPTPQDAQQIARADVIFFNGHGLEAWLDALFASANPHAPRVELSKDLQAVGIGGDFKQGNPHFWLNPQYAMNYIDVIRDTLSKVDPTGAGAYAANAAAYHTQLVKLDQDLAREAATIPATDRKIVTNHDAFPYFAQHYGFTIVGNILGNPEADLSAGDLAALVRSIRAQHVNAVFSESQFNPRITNSLAAEAGVKVVATLYTDSLSRGGEAASYVDMMRYDMHTIVSALTGKT